MDQFWLWGGFTAFVVGMLALDLGVFHRQAHQVTFKEALAWTGVWVALACLFGGSVGYFAGSEKALEFFTGYLIEYSLSADNVFVFALIFSYFGVPPVYQHRVLFWGILSALVMRGVMIALGAFLISHFAWVLYVFGGFLVLTGLKMVFRKEGEIHPEQNPLVRWITRLIPLDRAYHGDKFWIRQNGRLLATPLVVVLLCVEVSDIIFAVDSIPAIFAITLDPFIVWTSNVFAILGLRSLYFVLAGMIDKFHYLKVGLGAVLTYIGVKMLLAHTAWKIETIVSLGVVFLILAVSILASLLWPRKPAHPPVAAPAVN